MGRVPENRRMEVVFLGNLTDPILKIFIVAGQHGDEKGSRRSAELLISHLIKNNEFPDICVAVLSNANPDGGHRKKRKASKIDLNRDHLLLSSTENKVIHSFIQSWKPNVILDLHNFPPTREYLTESNNAFYHDVLLDGPTNPNGINGFDSTQLNNLLGYVKSNLNELKFECERQVLIYPGGKARHSTHDIVDLRNFMSVRYNILTILVEGKEPLEGSDYDTQLQRTISAQYHAVLSIIKWIIENKSILNGNHVRQYSKGERYSIREKYVKSDKPFTMNFLNTTTNETEEVAIPEYYSSMVTSRFVRIPNAYGIPVSMNKIVDLLHIHGFTSLRVDGTESYKVQEYLILSCDEVTEKDKPRPPKNVRMIAFRDERSLEDYEIFPVDQQGGHSLLLLVEPQSEYGLSRYEKLGLKIGAGTHFPILRITDDKFKKT